MTFIAAKWTIDEYHRMIAAGILRDTSSESLCDRVTQPTIYDRSSFYKHI